MGLGWSDLAGWRDAVFLMFQARAKLAAGSAAGGAQIDFRLQDVEAADFPDGAFDFVLCSNGMAYLQVGFFAFRLFVLPVQCTELAKLHLWLWVQNTRG